MSREWLQFLQDILDACRKTRKYTNGMGLDEFRENSLVIDAVVLNLLIIGEASKHLPDEAKLAMGQIEWSLAARFRDLVAHHYFTIDPDLVWEIVRLKIPLMENAIKNFMK